MWRRWVGRISEPSPFRGKKAGQWGRLSPPMEPPMAPLGAPILCWGSVVPRLPLSPGLSPQQAPREDLHYSTVVFTAQHPDSEDQRPSQRPPRQETEYSAIGKTQQEPEYSTIRKT